MKQLFMGRRYRGTLFLLLVVLSAGLVCAPKSARASDDQAQTATQTTPTPLSYYACTASDVQKLMGPGGILYVKPGGKSADQEEFLRQRLLACKSLIDGARANQPSPQDTPPFSAFDLPLDPAAPPAAPDCAYPNGGTIEHAVLLLVKCASWVTQFATAPTGGTPPPPSTHYAEDDKQPTKFVYILALNSDAPTAAQISYQLTEDLIGHVGYTLTPPPAALSQPTRWFSYDERRYAYRPVAEPSWTLAQYQQQCQNDSSTAGAIVVMQTSSESESWNFIVTGGYTKIGMAAMVLDCEPTNQMGKNNKAYITWFSNPERFDSTWKDGQWLGVQLGSLLAIGSAALALTPSKTANFTYANPPAPPNGQAYETGFSVAQNQPAALAAAAGIGAFSPLAGQTIGYTPGADRQVSKAVTNDLRALLGDMQVWCNGHSLEKAPIPTPAPVPSPGSAKAKKPKPPAMTQCAWFEW